MFKVQTRFHIGMRTLKTAAAVILSLIIVYVYGTTTSRLIFAMLGAMAALQPTFGESVESCLTQIVGVLFGAIAGLLLTLLPIHPLFRIGIGIILVITLYNALRLRFSPGLPCLIVVTICTTPDIRPFAYAASRIWDTAIGLGTGMLINTLVFPYDNSRQIRRSVESLERDVITLLEDMFDGDGHFPSVDELDKKIAVMAQQLHTFSSQKLVTRLRKQQQELEIFRLCESKAKELLAHMVVLCRMDPPGSLSAETRALLLEDGASIPEEIVAQELTETDMLTNYHVTQILILRKILLAALDQDS